MKKFRRYEGQTLIETALILFLLMLIVLGISEFARAWFTKNSIKNAARTAVRVAVVTSGITDSATATKTSTPADCSGLIGNAKVFCYVWKAPSIKNGATATINIDDLNANGLVPDSGDTVSMTVSMNFSPITKLMSYFIPTTLTADAAMRYE